jgi:hypothetical protein
MFKTLVLQASHNLSAQKEQFGASWQEMSG